MQTLAAGAQAYQLADGVGKVADAVKNQTGQQGAVLLSVEAGFGFKTASKEQNQNYRQSQQSSLKAGGDINIRSREGDITVQGSNITAGDTIRLDSARDIRLQSAQDSQHQDGKNRNAGVQVGVGVSVGAQTGVYIYAEAAYGKGKNRSDSQTHQNTLLQSDKLQLSSKGNTVLNGAQAHARRIDADVGGTLYIESPQDTVEQESKQSGGGIRAQVALGTAWNVSGNYNQSKASGHSRSVGSQSGLFAGEGGYHITADSVRLKGGTIASAADKDHNELTARSFSFEDIRNESSYSASSMGIGAGYGGSLKGSDGFNQSAFGRASQTAGQNMNKGFNYSPTLPQHESGGSQGYTRSVLSEGNITIGGKKTSARALGIHTDSATAHHSADSVPDLQKLLDKQQTVAQSTAAIHSAVGTYRGNRAKAAAEELEKQQAAHEGSLKERNDGSYEHYLSLSDAQRQQEMLAHSPAYAQAYQEARSWGVGGSKSRALSAAETLITGALGGQGDLQLAANTLAPYAAAAIGKRFGHGEHKNEAAQAIGHFMLGAALAYANGADPLAGGSAAVAAERAAEYLAKQYDDGKTAIDPTTGKFNPNLLPEHIKEEIKAQTGAIASVVGAAGGSLKGGSGTNNGNSNALFNAQVGGVLGQNAVENNQLDTQQMNAFIDGMNLHCKTGNESACEAVKRTFTLLDKNQREKLQDTCSRYPRTKVCADLIGKAQEGDALIVDQFNTQTYDILGNKMMMGIFLPEDICNNPTCVTEIKKQDARNIKDKNYLVHVLGSQDAKNIRKGNLYIIRYIEERAGNRPINTLSDEEVVAYHADFMNGLAMSAAAATGGGAKALGGGARQVYRAIKGSGGRQNLTTDSGRNHNDNINIGKNDPRFNQQRHEKIESHNPNRIEAIRQRNAISSAERQADALKGIQAPDRTRLPGNTLSGKLGAPREMNRSPNPSQTAEAFAIRYLGRKPTADELKKGFGMNGGNCVGCWRATTPNGTIVYRPAGYAGKDTLPTTATVEIHKNPAIRSLNNNENLKLKFPIK